MQAAAIALLARQLRLERIYLLDDGEGTGYAMTRYVRRAAKRLGLTVAGVPSWNPNARTYAALAARVRDARPDGIVLTGCMCLNGRPLMTDLRRALDTRVRFIGSDNFAGDAFGGRHVRAFDGLYLTFTGRGAEAATERGRRLASDFAPGRPAAAIELYVLYAAQAAELLLDAVARSDGTRGRPPTSSVGVAFATASSAGWQSTRTAIRRRAP